MYCLKCPAVTFSESSFFALVAVAALTSTISLLEAVVAYCMEAFGWVRKKATLVALSLAAALGIISSLSQGPLQGVTIFRQTIFDFLDYLTSNYLLTISALLTSIFVGHKMDKAVVERQIANGRANPGRYLKLFSFTIRYITPRSDFGGFHFRYFVGLGISDYFQAEIYLTIILGGYCKLLLEL